MNPLVVLDGVPLRWWRLRFEERAVAPPPAAREMRVGVTLRDGTLRIARLDAARSVRRLRPSGRPVYLLTTLASVPAMIGGGRGKG